MPKLKFSPTVLNTLHSTDVIPPLYCCYPSACINVIPQCTEYPPQYWSYPQLYWCYPPLYWTTSKVLKVSPTVLKLTPHMYCCYPPQYWRYPSTVLMLSPRMYWCYPLTVLNNLQCTEAVPPQYWSYPHCTKQPPQYWSYPPQYWNYPPQHWCYPPEVLNNLQSTEQPPQYWTDVIWGGNTLGFHLPRVALPVPRGKFRLMENVSETKTIGHRSSVQCHSLFYKMHDFGK